MAKVISWKNHWIRTLSVHRAYRTCSLHDNGIDTFISQTDIGFVRGTRKSFKNQHNT